MQNLLWVLLAVYLLLSYALAGYSYLNLRQNALLSRKLFSNSLLHSYQPSFWTDYLPGIPFLLLRAFLWVLCILLLVGNLFACRLLFCVWDPYQMSVRQRKWLRLPGRFWCYLLLALQGYWLIRRKVYKGLDSQGQPHWITQSCFRKSFQLPAETKMVICNHVAFEEGFLLAANCDQLVFTPKIEIKKMPVFAQMYDSIQSLWIDRSQGKQHAIQQIQDFVADTQNDLAVMLFPEGTSFSSSVMLNFKGGAFLPGVPVQPFVVQLGPGAGFYYNNLYVLALFQMSHFYNPMTLVQLPLYVPSVEERADWKLFAQNVRHQMALAGGLQETDLWYEDIRAAEKRIQDTLTTGSQGQKDREEALLNQ